MNDLLKRIGNIHGEGCVSIIFNTHRTKPDSKQDIITLKNLIKEAENKLLNKFEKRFAASVIDRLNKAAGSMDQSISLDSLIIYANPDFAEYTRLPIKVEDRVTIDNTFATRDLIRAMNLNFPYYVLLLSRQKARLIEAHNDQVIAEVKGKFPINNIFEATDTTELSVKKGQDNLTEEFFNNVDKILLETIKDNQLPVILATESRNVEHYMNVANKKEIIIGSLNGIKDNAKPNNIVRDAWPVAMDVIKQRDTIRFKEIDEAISAGRLISDLIG